MENLKSVVGDAKISPNCLMSKFKRSKIAAVRSFPESFTRFDNVAVGEKLVYGEPVVVCERNADSTLGYEISGDKKDGEQIVQIGSVDECGSTEHIDMMNVVVTLKRNFQVGDGDCIDMVNELKTRECERIKPKRRMVSSLRDFPKDLRSYAIVDKKYQEHCLGKSGDVETNDECHEHLKVDFMSQGGLVDPVVGAFSSGEEFEKQEPVVTVKLVAVLQSDVDLEFHDEAIKHKEAIGEFECGEYDNNSFPMVENVPIVENALEDAENPHLLNKLCSLVYPCRFPKRRKVSAVRDFPDAFKILKAHNKASEKNLKHREANKLAGANETTCDSQDDVEHIETEIESQESSAPNEKGLSHSLRTLLTPKEDTLNFGANTVHKLTSVGHDGTGADKQELSNCGANSTPLSTQSSSEVTNSNKRIGGKKIGVKCENKTIVEDSIATPRCPSMPTQHYRSDSKTNQGKGKVLKRKQNKGSAPITVILALMAPTRVKPTATNV
uniref:Uncharacterized protein n=1 Tax=Solanum tuberosum TaxID=4113 RepID=M1DFZ8_SOLTU